MFTPEKSDCAHHQPELFERYPQLLDAQNMIDFSQDPSTHEEALHPRNTPYLLLPPSSPQNSFYQSLLMCENTAVPNSEALPEAVDLPSDTSKMTSHLDSILNHAIKWQFSEELIEMFPELNAIDPQGPDLRTFFQRWFAKIGHKLRSYGNILNSLELVGSEVLRCFNQNNFEEFFVRLLPNQTQFINEIEPPKSTSCDFDFRIQINIPVNQELLNKIKDCLGETIASFLLPEVSFTPQEIERLILGKPALINKRIFKEDEDNHKLFALYTLPMMDDAPVDIKIGDFAAYCLTPADSLAVNTMTYLYTNRPEHLKMNCYHFSFKEYLISNFTHTARLAPRQHLNPMVFPWVLAKLLKGARFDSIEDFEYVKQLFFNEFGSPVFDMQTFHETNKLPRSLYYLHLSVKNHLSGLSLAHNSYYLQLFIWLSIIDENANALIRDLAKFYVISRKNSSRKSLSSTLYKVIQHLSTQPEDIQTILAAFACFGMLHTSRSLGTEGRTNDIELSINMETPCFSFQLSENGRLFLSVPASIGENMSRLSQPLSDSLKALIVNLLRSLKERFPLQEGSDIPKYTYNADQLNLLGAAAEFLPEIVNQSVSLPFSVLRPLAHAFITADCYPKSVEGLNSLLKACEAQQIIPPVCAEKLAEQLNRTLEELRIPPELSSAKNHHFEKIWWTWLDDSLIEELNNYAYQAALSQEGNAIEQSIRSQLIEKFILREMSKSWIRAIALFRDHRRTVLNRDGKHRLEKKLIHTLPSYDMEALLQFLHTFVPTLNLEHCYERLTNPECYLSKLLHTFKKRPLTQYMEHFLLVLDCFNTLDEIPEEQFWEAYLSAYGKNLGEFTALLEAKVLENVPKLASGSFIRLVSQNKPESTEQEFLSAYKVIALFQPEIVDDAFASLLSYYFTCENSELAIELLNETDGHSVACSTEQIINLLEGASNCNLPFSQQFKIANLSREETRSDRVCKLLWNTLDHTVQDIKKTDIQLFIPDLCQSYLSADGTIELIHDHVQHLLPFLHDQPLVVRDLIFHGINHFQTDPTTHEPAKSLLLPALSIMTAENAIIDDIWTVILDQIPSAIISEPALFKKFNEIISQLVSNAPTPSQYNPNWILFLPAWWTAQHLDNHRGISLKDFLEFTRKLQFEENPGLPLSIQKRLVELSIEEKMVDIAKMAFEEIQNALFPMPAKNVYSFTDASEDFYSIESSDEDFEDIEDEWLKNALFDILNLMILKINKVETIYAWLIKITQKTNIYTHAASDLWVRFWNSINEDALDAKLAFIDQNREHQNALPLDLNIRQLDFLVKHPNERKNLTFLERAVNLYQMLPRENAEEFRNLLQERFFETYKEIIKKTDQKKCLYKPTIKLYKLLITFISSQQGDDHKNADRYWKEVDIKLFNDILSIAWEIPSRDLKEIKKGNKDLEKKYGSKAFLSFFIIQHDMANPIGYSHSNNVEVKRKFLLEFLNYPHWCYAPSHLTKNILNEFYRKLCQSDEAHFFFKSLIHFDQLLIEERNRYLLHRMVFLSNIAPFLIHNSQSEDMMQELIDIVCDICKQASPHTDGLIMPGTERRMDYTFNYSFIEPTLMALIHRLKNNENESIPKRTLLVHLLQLLSCASDFHKQLTKFLHANFTEVQSIYNESFQLFADHYEEIIDFTSELLSLLNDKAAGLMLSRKTLINCLSVFNPENQESYIAKFIYKKSPQVYFLYDRLYLPKRLYRIHKFLKNDLSFIERLQSEFSSIMSGLSRWKGFEIEREIVLSKIGDAGDADADMDYTEQALRLES